MRRISLALAVLLAIVAGVASASVLTAGSGAEPSVAAEDATTSDFVTGAPVADARGAADWAVRVFDGDSRSRCMMVGRLDGGAFGPADASGRVRDTTGVVRGSCADPGDEPLQVALARYPDAGGRGPRTVLFGVAGASVASIDVAGPGVDRSVEPDGARTFVVVSDGLAEPGSWTVVAKLSGGASRSYHL